jgi:cell shape-determining protein MreC
VQTGQLVNTVGFKAGQLQDLYPPGIPISQVSYVGNDLANNGQVQDPGSDTGVLEPAVGNPNQLVLQDLPRSASVQTGQLVNTVGFKAGQLQDLYPPGIPIGQVSYVGNDLANNGQVQVTPVADLRHFAVVQILTAPHAGNARAQLPTG